MSPPELTIEAIDAALHAAHGQDVREEDLALLWAARAALVGVALQPGHLRFVLGVSEQRAEDLLAILAEHGFLERDREAEAVERAIENGWLAFDGYTDDGVAKYRIDHFPWEEQP